MAKTEIILGEAGGGKVETGTEVIGSSDVSISVGFTPKKIYVYKLADGGSTNVAASSVSLIYDSDNGANQYRMICATTGSTGSVNCLPCPTTSYNNCIKGISSSGFTFNAQAYQGTYYWVAVG